MTDGRLLSPRRRDLLAAILALALVTGPVWASALHLDDTTYHYTRTEVVVDDTNIEYANETSVSRPVRISDDVGCQNGREARVCAFEALVLENQTIASDVYTSNPNYTQDAVLLERYEYVLANGTVYETVSVPNESVHNDDGLYRLDLGLEQVSPERVLARVSLTASDDEVPSAVASAARTGDGYAPRELDVPETPIRLGDDTYYRVYVESWSDPGSSFVVTLLTYGGPLLGGFTLWRLSQRVRVTYVGDDTRRRR